MEVSAPAANNYARRLVALLLFLVAYHGAVFAANISSAKTGNWNDPTVWSGGVVPVATDNVTIISPHVVSMNASGAVANITVNSGGTLQFNSTTTAYSLTFAPGSTITVNGTLDMGMLGSLVSGPSGTTTVTMGASSTLKTSNLTAAPVGALGPGAGASLQTQGTGIFNLTSLETAGTVMYVVSGGGSYAISDRDYNTLFLSGSGNLTWAMTANRTVKGNLQLSATSMTISGGYNVLLGGNLNPSVGGTFNGGGSTIVFNGAAGQSISYNDVLGGSFLFSNTNVNINKAAGLTVSTSRKSTIGGSMTVTSGTLSIPSSFDAMAVNGAFVNNGTVTYTSSSLTVGGDFTNSGTVNGGTGTFQANVTNNGMMTAGTASITGNVTNTASGTFSYSGSTVTVGGDFTNSGAVTAGTATITGNLSNSGTVTSGVTTLRGNLANTGSFVSAGTFTFNGTAAQSATGNAISLLNLTMNNAAGLTLGLPLTVTQNLTMQAGTLAAGANLTFGPSVSVVRTTASTLVGTPTFGASLNVTYNFSATAPSISPGPEFPIGVGILNNLTINGGTTLTLDRNIDPKGILTLSGTTTVLNAGTFNIAMKGNWTNSASVNAFNPGTGTVTWDGAANATLGGSFGTTFNNLAVAFTGANILTISQSPTVNGLFTLASGTIAPGATVITAKGDFINNASATAVTIGTSTLSFNGIAPQALGGTFPTSLYKLTVNNSAGVTLGNNVTVNNVLTLTSGNITTGANALSLASGGSVTRTSGHVVGNFQKAFATGSNVTKNFEIGSGSDYSPVSLTFASISAGGLLTATTAAAEHPDVANSGLDATKDVNRYWTITNNGLGFNNYNATFTFVPTDVDPLADPTKFEVRKLNTPTWTFTNAGTRTATSTQALGLTSFSDFAVGTVIPVTPAAPTLVSPANGAIDQIITPALSWNAVYGADTYNLTVATDAGFSNVVINQAGLTATSYPVVTPLANSQPYYWHVTATNVAGTGLPSADWNFTTIIAIPPAPVLVSPADQATGVSTTPTLTWNPATGAATYRVQIAADAGFASILIDAPGVATTSYVVPTPLGTSSPYYWRVNATNVGGTGPYSSVYAFTTLLTAPAVPTLVSPANFATNVTRIPTLAWNAVLGATSYGVQIATDAAFSSPVVDVSGLSGTSYVVTTPLNAGTVYYWHVNSANIGGTSAFSGAWSFTTRSNSAITSTKTGIWNDATVWSTGYVPSYGDPVTIATGHTVSMNASASIASLTVTGTLQFNSTTTAYSLTFAPGSTITVNGTLDMGMLGSLVSGPSGTTTVTMGASSTLKTSNLTAAPVGALGPGAGASLQTQGTGIFNLTSLETAGTVMYVVSGGGSYAISDRDYNTLFLSGSGNLTWAMTANRTVKGNLQLSATSMTISGGYNVLLGGNLNPSVGGTFNGGGSTIVFNGAAGQSISYNDVLGGSFLFSNTNVNINKAAGLTVSTSRKSTIGGSMTVTSGTLSIPSSFDAMAVNGAFVNNGTVTYTSSSLTVGGDFTNSGTVNGGTATITGSFTNSDTVTFAGATTISGSFTNSATGRIRYSSTTLSLGGNFINDGRVYASTTTVGGNVVNSSTGTVTGGVFTVAGNVTHDGPGNFINNGSMTFNGAAPQTLGGSGSLMSLLNLTLSNAAALTLNFNIDVKTTLTIGPNAVLTPAPDVVFNAAAVQGTITGSGTAKVTRTAATADFSSQYRFVTNTLTSLTVDYAGTAAQTINALTYGGLKISNTVGATLAGNIGVGKDFTNNGVFNPAGFLTTFSLTNAQNITGSSPSNFAGMTVNKTAGSLTLGQPVTVNGLLTLTAGNITTGANALTIESAGSVARTAGHIVGNLRKQVGAGSAVVRTYEVGTGTTYAPFNVTFANVSTPGYLTGTTVAGDHPGIASARINSAKSVNRYWTLTNDGVAFDSYDAILNFVAGDLDGSAVPANFVVDKFSSPTWSPMTIGTRTATSTQFLGATSFSDFIVGEAATPAIVVTASLTPFNTTTGTPSAEQSYTVAGSRLTGNLTVTPPTGFELSLTTGTGFTTTPLDLAPVSFTVPTTTIFVRLNSATPGTPSGNITHVSPGATQQDVPVSGTVSTPSYALNLTIVGNGTVAKLPDAATYTQGTDVQLTAAPAVGWHFVGWSVDTASAVNPITIPMWAAKNITATFAIDQYALNVTVIGPGSVAKSPDQPLYDYNANVTLTATPQFGYSFMGWSGDTTGSTNPLIVPVNGLRNIMATFGGIKIFTTASAVDTTARLLYPNPSWRTVVAPPPYNGADDWSISGDQPVTIYVAPETGATIGAGDLTFEWDPTVLALQGVDFAGSIFSGPHLAFATWDLLGTTNRVRINASLTSPNNAVAAAGAFLAKLNFVLKAPGYTGVAAVAADIRMYNPDYSQSAVPVTPHQAELRAYLGDVGLAGGATTGDGKLEFDDLALWSYAYWSGVDGYGPGMTNYIAKGDIGPTMNRSYFSLPAHTLNNVLTPGPDAKIDFEDLVIFSMGYRLSRQGQLRKSSVKQESPIVVAIGDYEPGAAETRVPVQISGGVSDVRAVSLTLAGQFGKFLGVENGKLLQSYSTPVSLMSRSQKSRVFVDLAIMGLDNAAVGEDGEVVVLRFEGRAHVGIAKADFRSSQNNALDVNIKDPVKDIPESFALSQNYPNPFNPSTTLEYEVPNQSKVSILIYNILGEVVAVLVDEIQEGGFYRVTWNGTSMEGAAVGSGVYFCRMHAGQFSSVKKMLLMK